jgi:hypothetical protein
MEDPNTRTIGEMMSTPTGNRQLVHDNDTAGRSLNSVDHSVDDRTPPVVKTLFSSGDRERSTDVWDRDPSWVAQQANKEIPNVTRNVHRRKMSRNESSAMVHEFNAFSQIDTYQVPRIVQRDNPQDVDHDKCDDNQEDQVRFLNPPYPRWRAWQNRSSAYAVKKRAQSSAAGRSESPYAPFNTGNAREGQSSDQSQSSERIIASGPGPRTPVRTIAGACESKIQRASQNNDETLTIFANQTERFDINDEDDHVRECDGSEWYQQYPRRDEGKHSLGKGKGNNKSESECGSYIAGVSSGHDARVQLMTIAIEEMKCPWLSQ